MTLLCVSRSLSEEDIMVDRCCSVCVCVRACAHDVWSFKGHPCVSDCWCTVCSYQYQHNITIETIRLTVNSNYVFQINMGMVWREFDHVGFWVISRSQVSYYGLWTKLSADGALWKSFFVFGGALRIRFVCCWCFTNKVLCVWIVQLWLFFSNLLFVLK